MIRRWRLTWAIWRRDRAETRTLVLNRRISRLEVVVERKISAPEQNIVLPPETDEGFSELAALSQLVESGPLVIRDHPSYGTFTATPSSPDPLEPFYDNSPEADHAWWEMTAEDHLGD